MRESRRREVLNTVLSLFLSLFYFQSLLSIPHIINPKAHTIMTARQLAIKDIKECLEEEGRIFLAYHNELNPIMRKLVNNQIKEQKHAK